MHQTVKSKDKRLRGGFPTEADNSAERKVARYSPMSYAKVTPQTDPRHAGF